MATYHINKHVSPEFKEWNDLFLTDMHKSAQDISMPI